MKLFTVKSIKTLGEPGRLIGHLATQFVDEYITLIALTKRTTKSALLREIVNDWISANPTTEVVLRNRLAKHCFNYFMSNFYVVEENNSKRFSKFIKDVKYELRVRSVADDTIANILIKLNELSKKHKEEGDQ